MFIAARRIAVCVLRAAGDDRVKEEDILGVEADKENDKELLKEFGFVKITRNGV